MFVNLVAHLHGGDNSSSAQKHVSAGKYVVYQAQGHKDRVCNAT